MDSSQLCWPESHYVNNTKSTQSRGASNDCSWFWHISILRQKKTGGYCKKKKHTTYSIFQYCATLITVSEDFKFRTEAPSFLWCTWLGAQLTMSTQYSMHCHEILAKKLFLNMKYNNYSQTLTFLVLKPACTFWGVGTETHSVLSPRPLACQIVTVISKRYLAQIK